MKSYRKSHFFWILMVLNVLFVFQFTTSCKNAGIKQPPNLLFVFPDEMRGQAMGFVGEEQVLTPSLDKFADEGIVFDQAVSNYPVCSPFRAMLMTGKYSISNGVLANCNSRSALYDNELKKDARTWSDILSEKGYSMGYIGKWHLDAPYEPFVDCANNKGKVARNEWCPPERRHGFDFWYSYGTYDFHLRPLYWATDAPRDGFHYVDQWGPEHEADMAIKYIRNEGEEFRKSGKPFALVVSMNPPHPPYELVPERYKDIYKEVEVEELCKRPNILPKGTKWGDYYRDNIKNYYALITGVDEQFGRILEVLKQEGLEENTIVVFASDHGDCLGIHEKITKNNHYEESMRIPFILRWTGNIKPRHNDLLLSSPDIYPTLLDLMGYSDDIPQDVEGVSYAQLILTGEGERPSSQLYTWIPYTQREWGRRGVRTSQFTLVISKMPDQPDEIVLHDNLADPYQLKNIASEKPEIVQKLTEEELVPRLKELSDPWLEHLIVN